MMLNCLEFVDVIIEEDVWVVIIGVGMFKLFMEKFKVVGIKVIVVILFVKIV